MKIIKTILLSATLLSVVIFMPSALKAYAVTCSAKSAILLCSNNNQVVFEQNASERLPMASTTKILTSLITLEAAREDNKTIVFTNDMVAEGSSMYLKVGYRLTLRDLAVGMMTVSGNDAANAAALSLAGSYGAFADIMNSKAYEIGMYNSHFVTPSGLDDSEHFSTAYDMAVLMSFAMKNDDFAEITKQKSISVNFSEPENFKATYYNHNKLLSMYEFATGGKTGYTKKAGRCLVSCAEKDGLRLVAVTLDDHNDWEDHINLYEYGFDKLKLFKADSTSLTIPLVGGFDDNIHLCADNGGYVINSCDEDKIQSVIELPDFVYAPINSGDIIGKIKYTLNDEVIAEENLLSEGDYEYKNETVTNSIFSVFRNLIFG